jgi:hypothetical protein
MPEYDPVRYTVERNGISLSFTVDSLEASVGLQLMSTQTPIFDAGFDGVVDRIEIEHTRAGRRLLIKTADGLNSIVQVDPEIRLWLQARQIF